MYEIRMVTARKRWLTLLAFFQACLYTTLACGGILHTEIGHRALLHFSDYKGNSTYQQLILKHQDAFQAGNPYPDAYYPSICAGGKYHDIAEDTHWTEFFNATVDYIRTKYPPPWDEATEKLVVFMFGYMSHQVADVVWHNLGIQEGFLQTMANLNFHGVFGVAHSAGDFGGDILTLKEMNLGFIGELSDWYVPRDDLYNIYMNLYGKERMPMSIIEECTSILFLARLGEKIAVSKLYSDYAKKSPFLLNQLSDYFAGGVDDMAMWTQVIWKAVIQILDHGYEGCSLPHNPIYITCNQTTPTDDETDRESALETGIPARLSQHGLSYNDIVVERVHRGIRFRASPKLKEFVRQRNMKKLSASKQRQNKKLESNQLQPNAVYTTKEKYAKVGWALAVGDLNNDGHDDLAIGAPGHGSQFSYQDGKVFIIYGSETGLPLKNIDNLETADRVIAGPFKASSRFGSSIAIVDVNLDGINDLAIGAPSFKYGFTSPNKYNGMVYVYYGSAEDMFRYSHVNMTVACEYDFCNQGWYLSSGDMNGDGHPDLLMSSPFAPDYFNSSVQFEQRGYAGAIFASKKYNTAYSSLGIKSLDWGWKGTQDYGWYGQRMDVRQHPSGQKILFVSQPNYRNCTMSSCGYNPNDTQSEGSVHMYFLPVTSPYLVKGRFGQQNFQEFGAFADIGRPLPNGNPLLAVSAVGEGVEGKVVDISMEFPQAGVIHLLNITDLSIITLDPVATYAGDRRFGRFGSVAKFADVNQDGLDDLIVTAPFRTDDITEEFFGAEEGRVYIFSGGDKFPLGDKAMFGCDEFTPVQPCPGQKASYELVLGEDMARFGSNVAVLKSKSSVQVIVSAIHSSKGEQLSGAVTVFSFPKSP